jgi:hypothetical protein
MKNKRGPRPVNTVSRGKIETMNIENYTQDELDALEKQTNTIADNLRYIEESEVYQEENLDDLETRIASILDSLQEVHSYESLDELEERIDSILEKLQEIKELKEQE